MQILKINTRNKKDRRKFIQFPFKLHRENPNWVPPMLSDMEFSLNRNAHPFYKHSNADFFIAIEKGEILGRIAAVNNHRYKQFTGDNAGFFYYFESINDREISRILFNTVFEWARNRKLNKILGPKGLLQGDGLGLLIDGFEYKPAMGIPYNPRYYADLIVDAGFEKDVDYLSGYLTSDYTLPDRLKNLVEKVKQRRGFWVKDFETKNEMKPWIPKIRDVYNAAFIEVPNFIPITDDEVQVIAKRILSIADPRLVKLIFKGDDLIGFLFSYHNISEGIQKSQGKILPFGWYHLMRSYKNTRWVDINGIGLLPKYQGVGATAILFAELEKSIKYSSFEKADFVQIAESNLKSLKVVDHLGVKWHKKHRIYKRSI